MLAEGVVLELVQGGVLSLEDIQHLVSELLHLVWTLSGLMDLLLSHLLHLLLHYGDHTV